MNSRAARTLGLAMLAVLAVPATAQQDESRPYFVLSSNQTYLPGEKGSVEVWMENVSTLEFRVYRVNDPVAFFGKLGDLHEFGGAARPLRREQTWLERFHGWKRTWRTRIREVFRTQFTAESRARIREWMEGEGEQVRAPVATQFAEVPVLNPQQLVSTWKQSFKRPKHSWESQSVSMDLPSKGVFLVEAVSKDQRAYTILIVSELGLILKAAPGRMVAFAHHRITGTPVPNLPVRFWVDRKEVAQQTTDSSGLADTAVNEERPEDALVLARSGDDFAVSATYAWYLGTDPDRYWTGYLYTDRPVYRPTHTVQFKGILRTQAGGRYGVPAGRVVEAEIQDSEGNRVFRKDLPVSAMGTVQGSFDVPANARLGYYSLVVRSGEARSYSGFHVEEYRKPEYEVRVLPDVRRVLQGNAITARLEARYYFGEPVVNAKVSWVVHRSIFWLYPRDEDEEEFDEEGAYDYGGEQVLEESGTLDAQGRIAIRIPTQVSEKKNDLRYRIEARVTDAAGREITGHSFVLATYASFGLQVQPQNYVYRPGDKARFTITARDYDGKPVSTSVRVSLHGWRWREAEQPAVFSAQATTGAQGKAEVEIPLATAGSFYAQATATAPEGREVQDRAYVWVTGGDASWYGSAAEQVRIVPDKRSYQPGDTARVLVIASKPGVNALVTVDGNQLYSRQVVAATESTFTVELPIRSEYAPNVYVSVAFLSENKFYTGTKLIRVPPNERKIQMEVTSKEQYQPGEPAMLTLTARDYRGNPVAGEFSLGVVDEAIYAIRPESTTDILQFFYGRQHNRTNTQTSLTYYFRGASSKRAMELASGYRGGGSGRLRARLAQLKPSTLVDPRVRKAFPDTAYWIADLTTDAHGQASARLEFPDSLTTWRITTRGVTSDTKVGSAVHRTLVRKNLILRQATPRFFRQGDEVIVPSIVHNYLAAQKDVRVSLEAKGLELVEGQTRNITVASRGEASADWRLRSPSPGNATLLGKALTNEESDAVELMLPVIPFGVKMAAAAAGSISGASQSAEAQIVFPEKIEPQSRSLEITVSPSLAGALFGALDYLTTFPYGCTEQTMSSFLPNIVVSRALKELGVKSNVDPATLEKKIREGLERLYQLQHPDGGWGWWATDESEAFMTAYVVAGLAQAREAGYNIDNRRLDSAVKWLRTAFDRESRALPDLRAYLAYALALAGHKDTKVLDAVWSRRNDLTHYGRALLGLAFSLSADRRAEELAAQLETQATVTDSEAQWPSDRDTLMDFHGDTTPETTAHAMKLLSRLRPASPLLPKAAAWLLNHRNEGYYWYSTKQTAMVIYGITDYLEASGELKADYSLAVELNGRQVLSRRITAADVTSLDPPTLRFPASELAAGTNHVRIRKDGAGVLYWSARGDYYSTDEKLSATGTVQLNLLREYFRMVPAQDGERIVYRIVPLEGDVAPGDVLAVRLTVTGGQWRYLMIEDPIPAGTEFIPRDDLYQIQGRPSWWGFWFSHREFRDDRAVFFQNYFTRGQHQFLYLLKVTHRGTFQVSPARVQPMYQPNVLATTEGRTLVVR